METNDNLNRQRRLIELGGSDFEIADGQPDIRGWSVRDDAGQKVGKVDELLFDPHAQKVRYLVLDLKDNDWDLDQEQVVVPIGKAVLHDDDDDVLLPGVTVVHFRSLPAYHRDRFDANTEASVRSAFAGAGATGAAMAGTAATTGTDTNDDFYNHDIYNEDKFRRQRGTAPEAGAPTSGAIPVVNEEIQIGKREVETGGAIIRSRVVEKDVEEDIRLREEHVTVERNPVNRPATDADISNIKEGEIEIKEHAEVPVVNKEARVVEEINIGKEVEERDEVIKDTVRKTDVDIEELHPDDPRYKNRHNPNNPATPNT